MREEPSEDLLVYVSMQESNPEEAIQAFREFHHRFKEYVWNISIMLSRTISDPNQDLLAQDIFNDTFRDVYANYRSEGYFDPAKAQDIEGGIKAWLNGIAKNHLRRTIDANKKSFQISYLDDSLDHPFFDPEEEEPEEGDPPSLAALKHALDTVLNERERDVLLTSYQFEKEGKIPPEIKGSLCKLYGVLSVTLRQIKKRAKDKIEKYLQEQGYLT